MKQIFLNQQGIVRLQTQRPEKRWKEIFNSRIKLIVIQVPNSFEPKGVFGKIPKLILVKTVAETNISERWPEQSVMQMRLLQPFTDIRDPSLRHSIHKFHKKPLREIRHSWLRSQRRAGPENVVGQVEA